MPLFADLVGLRQPGRDFVIDLIHVLEPKGMEMISRRESFDAPETRILQPAREDDVAVDPIPANDERGETHADVKRYPRFLGENGDRPVLPGD